MTIRKPPRLLVERAKEIQAELDRVKPLYSELDEITLALVEVPDLSSLGVSLKDNFETKNISWKATGIRRFELILGSEKTKTKKTEDNVTKQETSSIVERLKEIQGSLNTIRERMDRIESGQAILAKKTPIAAPKKFEITPENIHEVAEDIAATVLINGQKKAAAKAAPKQPTQWTNKRTLSPEQLSKLAAARDAWFKKKGFGKYATQKA